MPDRYMHWHKQQEKASILFEVYPSSWHVCEFLLSNYFIICMYLKTWHLKNALNKLWLTLKQLFLNLLIKDISFVILTSKYFDSSNITICFYYYTQKYHYLIFTSIFIISNKLRWTARRSSQPILKEISPEYSLEGLMLKLKLQCFGYLMRRANSLEKTLMLGKIEGRKRRGQQKTRW